MFPIMIFNKVKTSPSFTACFPAGLTKSIEKDGNNFKLKIIIIKIASFLNKSSGPKSRDQVKHLELLNLNAVFTSTDLSNHQS